MGSLVLYGHGFCDMGLLRDVRVGYLQSCCGVYKVVVNFTKLLWYLQSYGVIHKVVVQLITKLW